MTTIRVTVEMDLTVENSTALRNAAAQTMYEVERDADRRGVTFSTGAGGELIEATQSSDAVAAAYLVQLELPYDKGLPGCSIGHSQVRAFEIVPETQEGDISGNRAPIPDHDTSAM